MLINYEIINREESLKIKKNISYEILYQIYEGNNSDYIELINILNNDKNDDFFIDIIQKKILFVPNIRGKSNLFLFEYIKKNINFITEFIQKTINFCNCCDDLKQKYAHALKENLKIIENIYRIENICDILKKLDEFNFPKLRLTKESESRLYIKFIIKCVKDIIKKIKKINLNDFSFFEQKKIFIDLIQKISNEVDIFKNKYKKFDFSDIEFMTLEILKKDEAIKNEVKNSFYEILIDEYQDINGIQDEIFSLISQRLFIVGDYKQSIYGFRGSLPTVFQNKKKYGFNINLNKNFRSKKQIIDFVNDCFTQIMNCSTNPIVYNEYEKLKYGANFSESNNDVNIYMLDLDKEKNKIIEEFKFILNIINDKIRSKMKINNRIVKYSDFCILVRNYNKYLKDIHKIFVQNNVKMISNNLSYLLEYNEIRDLLIILKVVEDPLDDISLISLLLGPIFEFNNLELEKIRQYDNELEFYFSLKKYANENNDKLSQKCKLFIDFFDELIKKYKSDSLMMFILYIIEKILCPFYDINSENFSKFLYLTNEFSKNNYNQSISRLVEYIKNQNYDILRQEFCDDDAVFVASIHSAKGKEYPICFLAGCSDDFIRPYDNVLFDSDLGLSFKFKNSDGVVESNIERSCMEITHDYKTRSEEMRLLYVALTRAKEELHIILSSYNAKKDIENAKIKVNLFDNIHPYFVLSSKNFYTWLLMMAFKSKNVNFNEISPKSDEKTQDE